MDCLSGWCKSERRLEGCTAIVTGCNTGIGKETALDFYARGARVVMACRNVEKAEAAREEIQQRTKSEKVGTLIIEKLDLCSLKSVREFVQRVLEREDRVQILVNNAGVMMCPEGRTEDGFETHIGSNHFGHALLTLLLLPTMIKSSPSRIVNVSSYLHARFDLPLDDVNFDTTPYDAYAAYCRSKAANVMFAKGLSRKLKVPGRALHKELFTTSARVPGFEWYPDKKAITNENKKEQNIEGVTTYGVHPGVIRTDIGRHFDKTVWFGASWAFNNIMGIFLKSPKCGAQTSIYCAVDEACADESGLYYGDCAVLKPSKQCQDEDQADRFLSLTVKTLKYDPFETDIPSKQPLA